MCVRWYLSSSSIGSRGMWSWTRVSGRHNERNTASQLGDRFYHSQVLLGCVRVCTFVNVFPICAIHETRLCKLTHRHTALSGLPWECLWHCVCHRDDAFNPETNSDSVQCESRACVSERARAQSPISHHFLYGWLCSKDAPLQLPHWRVGRISGLYARLNLRTKIHSHHPLWYRDVRIQVDLPSSECLLGLKLLLLTLPFVN